MKNKSLIKSFKYAFEGIFSSFKSERNMKIHFTFMLLVVVLGFLFKISKAEWLICVGCFASVIGSEMFNTAIETVVDMVCSSENKKAKLAKDVSAGGVLVFAIASVIRGLIIFLPKFMELFS